jgi:hypothetical protein
LKACLSCGALHGLTALYAVWSHQLWHFAERAAPKVLLGMCTKQRATVKCITWTFSKGLKSGMACSVVLLPCIICVQQVRLLEYDPAHDQLVAKASWVHPEEVWDISCCPGQPGTFVTAHAKGMSCTAELAEPVEHADNTLGHVATGDCTQSSAEHMVSASPASRAHTCGAAC